MKTFSHPCPQPRKRVIVSTTLPCIGNGYHECDLVFAQKSQTVTCSDGVDGCHRWSPSHCPATEPPPPAPSGIPPPATTTPTQLLPMKPSQEGVWQASPITRKSRLCVLPTWCAGGAQDHCGSTLLPGVLQFCIIRTLRSCGHGCMPHAWPRWHRSGASHSLVLQYTRSMKSRILLHLVVGTQISPFVSLLACEPQTAVQHAHVSRASKLAASHAHAGINMTWRTGRQAGRQAGRQTTADERGKLRANNPSDIVIQYEGEMLVLNMSD
jgi:hypothetical protein